MIFGQIGCFFFLPIKSPHLQPRKQIWRCLSLYDTNPVGLCWYVTNLITSINIIMASALSPCCIHETLGCSIHPLLMTTHKVFINLHFPPKYSNGRPSVSRISSSETKPAFKMFASCGVVLAHKAIWKMYENKNNWLTAGTQVENMNVAQETILHSHSSTPSW